MHTIEVPRADWSRALTEFSAIHDGWLVSLEILAPDLGAQPEITNLPLVGATFEATNGGTMTVAVEHVTHTIHAPRRLWIERTEAGADAALAVESADGTQTILRLRTAALPETVDGIARGPHRNPGDPAGLAR